MCLGRVNQDNYCETDAVQCSYKKIDSNTTPQYKRRFMCTKQKNYCHYLLHLTWANGMNEWKLIFLC